MAKIFLGSNEAFTVGANSTADVYGLTGGTEKVIATAGAVVNADQNVERVELSGAASSYTYAVAGNVVKVLSGTTVVASIGAGANAQTIAFSDGSAALSLTGLNAATLGGQAISATAAGAALTNVTLNAADKSTSAVAVTPVTPVTPAADYTIAPSATSVTEGNAVTFTVTAATAPTVATTLNYQVIGAAVGTSVAAATSADFSAINGSVTIAAGATTGTFTVTPTNDGLAEGYEGFKVSLLDSSYATVASSANVVIADGAATTSGQTFSLTTGADLLTGSTENDTFRANYSSTEGMSLTSDDILNGGNGTDLLNATIGATGIVQPTLTNIETFKAAFTAGGTVSLLGTTGLTSLVDNGSTAAATFSNISSANVALTAQSTNVAATFGFTAAALSGSTDNVAITLSNVTSGALSIEPSSGSNGAETITISSIDSANTLTSIDDNGSTSLTKLVINGNVALNLGTITPTTITSVDASAFTAALTIIDTSTSASTIIGGSGSDGITLSNNATADSIVAGAGNDSVTFAGNFTGTDTVAGGDGTDTLIVTSADAYVAAYPLLSTPTVTGFEVLRLSTTVASGTGTITTTSIDTGIKTVTLAFAGTNVAPTINFGAGSNTLNIGASTTIAALTAANLTVDAEGSLGTDSLTIKNNNVVTSTQNALATAAIVSTDFETVTVNTGSYTTPTAQVLGAVTITGSTNFTSAEKLIITGANVLTLGIVTADIIDASAMTASSGTVLTLVTGTTATSITGSEGNDVLISDVALANHSISGGAGNDTITGGTGNDTLLGGNNDDSITGATGNDSIDAGAGNDTVVLASGDLNSSDTLVGGDGTDVLSYTTYVAATDNDASAQQAISGFETFRLAGAAGAGVDVTLTNFINNPGFTSIELGVQGATASGYDFLNVSSNLNTVSIIDATSGTNTFDRLVDSSSNALMIQNTRSGAGAALTLTAFTALDEETITLTASVPTTAGANDLTITTLTVNDLTTLNITSASDVIVTTLTGAGNLTTVNASTSTGAVQINASSSAENITATAGSGAFTFVGGTGADTIIGGNSADDLTGGTGADSLSGFAGADGLTGGAGNDTLTGGAGADVFNFSTTNGIDTITDFVTTSDDINTAYAITAAAVTVTTATASVDITDDTEYYISTNGTAASVTTSGTATLTEADLYATTLTNLATFIDEYFTDTGAAVENVTLVINWTANGNDTSYVYEFLEASNNSAVVASELTLVGIVQHATDAILVSGDLI